MALKMPLTNLQNVRANAKATLKLPVGKNAPTYDRIMFALSGGATAAMITSIIGKANGKVFWEGSSAADLVLWENFRSIFTEASQLDIDFTEPKARNGAAEQLLAAIPGALLQDLSFELQLSGAFVGNITASAQYRPPTTNPWISKRLMTATSFAAAGSESAPNIIYLPTGNAGGKIKRIWIHEDTAGAGITHVMVRVGNNIAQDVDRTQLEHDQKRNGLTPQANICVLDFVEDGNIAGVLDTSGVSNVELRVSTAAAGAYRVYYELVDPIGRL